MTQKWDERNYTVGYTKNGRMGIAWLKPRIWILRGIRKGYERGGGPC
jgi:hypothetical protein